MVIKQNSLLTGLKSIQRMKMLKLKKFTESRLDQNFCFSQIKNLLWTTCQRTCLFLTYLCLPVFVQNISQHQKKCQNTFKTIKIVKMK